MSLGTFFANRRFLRIALSSALNDIPVALAISLSNEEVRPLAASGLFENLCVLFGRHAADTAWKGMRTDRRSYAVILHRSSNEHGHELR